PHARQVGREQQVLVGLQVDAARVLRAGDEVDVLGVLGVAHVEHGEAVRERLADIGVAAVDHDLDAVAAAALVAVADELDVLRRVGFHEVASSPVPPPRNSWPILGSARIACAPSCTRTRPSSKTMPSSEISSALLAFCSTIRIVTPVSRSARTMPNS